jgi:glycosyltransferase involved in cell wall biosynthesis
MKTKQPVSILYLGKRGGGAKLALQLAKDLEKSDKFYLKSSGIRADNDYKEQFDASNRVMLLPGGYCIASIFQILRYFISQKKLLADLRVMPGDSCIVPMVSPFGVIIEYLLKGNHIKIIYFLHDAKRHPGDFWPSTRYIKKITKNSDFIITLSETVSHNLKMSNNKLRTAIYPHPVFDFGGITNVFELPENFILFIGRIRDYKGLNNLVHAFLSLSPSDFYLVIAGQGVPPSTSNSNIIVINRWLKDSEIAELISKSHVVAFPYNEASQSGLIPFCISENKKILITPLPGLVEQVKGYLNLEVSDGFLPNDLMKSIDKLITQKISHKTLVKKNTTINLELCLKKSGNFHL